MIIKGDCIEEMKKLEENSVDAIITDPPYGLGFMNKEWDSPEKHRELTEREMKRSAKRKLEGKSPTDAPFSQSVQPGLAIKGGKENKWFQDWSEKWAIEAFRILKPGGYMLVCCATRMYHRMTCGIEDAGFEIRDTIMWLYGSGFPKSLNIGKQIDKIQGNEREVVQKEKEWNTLSGEQKKEEYRQGEAIRFDLRSSKDRFKDKGSSEWEGWGTALKPAVEPIVVARKPLSEKNVALNVLKHGTGGLNIDGCRINYVNDKDFDFSNRKNYRDYDIKKPAFETFSGDKKTPSIASETSETNLNTQGRFPANIILDEDAGKMLDEQSGILKGEIGRANRKDNNKHKETLYDGGWKGKVTETSIKDKGGASRFFYCAKASKSERNYGCDSIENIRGGSMDANVGKVMELGGASLKGNPKELKKVKNNHPTVKPIALIEYLIKLVSRKGAIVLDPFLGSGTTAIACLKLERQFIGIEKEEEYIEIAKARIKPFREQRKL